MVHLLNLLAAIALLVWGTQIVRTGILRVFGENLRHVLAVGMGSRVQALLAGVGVTVGSSRVDLQACKLEYSIVSPK